VTLSALAAMFAIGPLPIGAPRARGPRKSDSENQQNRESKRSGKRWRPFGERHADLDFTKHDQARLDAAAAKRARKAAARAKAGAAR